MACSQNNATNNLRHVQLHAANSGQKRNNCVSMTGSKNMRDEPFEMITVSSRKDGVEVERREKERGEGKKAGCC